MADLRVRLLWKHLKEDGTSTYEQVLKLNQEIAFIVPFESAGKQATVLYLLLHFPSEFPAGFFEVSAPFRALSTAKTRT